MPVTFHTLLRKYKNEWQDKVPEELPDDFPVFETLEKIYDLIYFKKEWPQDEDKAKSQKKTALYRKLEEIIQEYAE